MNRSDDWTQNCTSKTVDTAAFVDKLQAVRAGETVDWTCPFCGGNVGLIEQEDGHAVIGCDHCDMRISLDTR